jgi:hypothetical protein
MLFDILISIDMLTLKGCNINNRGCNPRLKRPDRFTTPKGLNIELSIKV